MEVIKTVITPTPAGWEIYNYETRVAENTILGKPEPLTNEEGNFSFCFFSLRGENVKTIIAIAKDKARNHIAGKIYNLNGVLNACK